MAKAKPPGLLKATNDTEYSYKYLPIEEDIEVREIDPVTSIID